MSVDELTFDEAFKLATTIQDYECSAHYWGREFYGEKEGVLRIEISRYDAVDSSHLRIDLEEKIEDTTIFYNSYPRGCKEFTKLTGLFEKLLTAYNKRIEGHRRRELKTALNMARLFLEREEGK